MDALRSALSTLHDEVYESSVTAGGQIEERHDVPTPLEFLRDFVKPNRPLIVRGYANSAEWRAFRKWRDSEYLITQSEGQKVTVSVTPNGLADAITEYNGKKYFVLPEERQMTVEELLRCLRGLRKTEKSEEIWYAQGQNDCFRNEFSFLADDIPMDIRVMTSALNRQPDNVNIWIGTEKSYTSMHRDFFENWYVVLTGSKTFRLCNPSEAARLSYNRYPTRQWKRDPLSQKWKLEELQDVKETPWIDETTVDRQHSAVVTLGPGDALYLPSMWYHNVAQNAIDDDFVIAVNYWYDMDFDALYHYRKFINDIAEACKQQDIEG
eukprot:Clim_evm36s144 gene=Clim_evmTU36s144